jgi:methylated-DNA-[protein]-cysteine S-methyltransferase
MTVYTKIDSPVGELLLVGEPSATAKGGVALASVSMPEHKGGAVVRDDWHRDPEGFAEIVRQLRAYFDGELRGFDLETTSHGSPFQMLVWKALEGIPYGTTTSYGKIAETIGVPRGQVRAVGTAIGANPLLIVRPCHRVIGADGSMRGYAAGVPRKEILLVHEGALAPQLG